MPPKKNLENKTPTKKAPGKKPSKPRVRQVKPKLKIPTVIRIKIPPENNSGNMLPEITQIIVPTPKLTKKQLYLERKMDLANEVAAAQLCKKPAKVETEQTPDIIVPPKPKAKRGRAKKTVEPTVVVPDPVVVCSEPEPSTSASIPTDSEEAFEVAVPKKRKYVRKDPTKAAEKKPETVKATRGKKSLPLTPVNKTLKQTKLTDVNSGITKTTKTTPRAKKSSPIAAPITRCNTRSRKLNTGKTETEESQKTDVLQSPSILDQVGVPTLKKEFTSSADTTKTDPYVEPGAIDSRKTSLTSECLSWTKDISSSSTTSCVTVCSTDFVRIDKKMPIIKITPTTAHLNQPLNRPPSTIKENNMDVDSSSSSDSDSDSSENSPPQSLRSFKEFPPDLESRSLDLSTSSVSPVKSRTPLNSCKNSDNNEEISKISNVIDKLASKLKHFDLEIINWIGYEHEEVDMDRKDIQDIFRVLKEENEVITQCRHLRTLLTGKVVEDTYEMEPVPSKVDTPNTNKFLDSNQHVLEDTPAVRDPNDQIAQPVVSAISEGSENMFTSDKVKHVPFEQSYDDDDALSLFAESITGIESSRVNSSATSCTAGEYEEYVPLPVNSDKWEPAKRISYVPTAIDKQIDVRTRPVCEKQNADSTSINKDSEQYRDTPVQKNITPLRNNATPNKKPCLMAYVFKPLAGMKSGVFRGICFFNILSSCKNTSCRFPHVVPTYDEINAKIVRVSEETFIQEYILMRNWPTLRRKYGMCFVHECIRRDLTRILVEMGLDFVMKENDSCWEDAVLKVEVIECVLLHLNTVDLSVCEDLLCYKHQGQMLCEIFMQAIANTQNFSRFKPVFIKLTKFILSQDRTFPLEVATQILERICILPSELPLLDALLAIVKNTDQKILRNGMLGHFENQLSVANKEMYEQLLKMKKDASMCRPVLQNLYEPSPRPAEIEPVVAKPLVSEREKRYTSPDTTNLDTMNKPSEEPAITRTVDFNRAPHMFTIQRSFSNSNTSNDSSEEFRPQVVFKPNFNWRGRGFRMRGRAPGHMRGSPGHMRGSPGQMRGSPRPMVKRHVHQQNYGPSPSVCISKTVPNRELITYDDIW
ncbi:uncharacterized protein LOC135082380 isoform X1 [Ostrinia nubilalis]|uniref:uncharacterized protein LOC135082380 isoform X1 n=1 Tax=Ostrinia nubilalis TaxID=29057 RepID=UPI0030825983